MTVTPRVAADQFRLAILRHISSDPKRTSFSKAMPVWRTEIHKVLVAP